LESVAWWRLNPDVKHEMVTIGYGAWKQADYAMGALADDGSLAIIYLPSLRTFTVNLARLSGKAAARWFDPTSGESTTVEGSPFANTDSHELSPPGKNKAGDSDWVLVLEVVRKAARRSEP